MKVFFLSTTSDFRPLFIGPIYFCLAVIGSSSESLAPFDSSILTFAAFWFSSAKLRFFLSADLFGWISALGSELLFCLAN